MNENNLKNLINELKEEGALEKEAEELAYFSKNLSNVLNFERSLETKIRFLEKAGNVNLSSNRNFLFMYKPLFASILGAFLLLGFATVVSAQDSLPGQPLYPVKRATENVVSLINPSFNSEILMRRSREIKHLVDPSNKTNDNNYLNVKNAIKDYENELDEHKNIDKRTIEESKINLEEAKENSTEENKQEIEDVIRRTETESTPTSSEEKNDEQNNPENSTNHSF